MGKGLTGDSMRIKLTIQHEIKSGNHWLKGKHWYSRAAKAKNERMTWAAELDAALRSIGRWERIPPKTKRKLQFISHRSRRLDYDNYVAGCKRLLDACRDVCLIRNDTRKWVEVEYYQVTGREAKSYRTEIIVEGV